MMMRLAMVSFILGVPSLIDDLTQWAEWMTALPWWVSIPLTAFGLFGLLYGVGKSKSSKQDQKLALERIKIRLSVLSDNAEGPIVVTVVLPVICLFALGMILKSA